MVNKIEMDDLNVASRVLMMLKERLMVFYLVRWTKKVN